jgi:hypothetical protein
MCMMKSTPNSPTFLLDDLPLHWQMTRCEKYALASLVEAASASVAIEIGTYKGGSLQVISRRAEKVYSIDISPDCREILGDQFKNVEFFTGDSRRILPRLLKNIADTGEQLGFVLIDGDHTAEGVKADINAVLKFVPKRPLYIVFHDSFHPQCREGIIAADWGKCDYVHYVEIDFVPGVYHREAFDTAEPRSMYGGLAVALMKPEKRIGEIVIHQSQQGLYEAVLSRSCYTAAAA